MERQWERQWGGTGATGATAGATVEGQMSLRTRPGATVEGQWRDSGGTVGCTKAQPISKNLVQSPNLA